MASDCSTTTSTTTVVGCRALLCYKQQSRVSTSWYRYDSFLYVIPSYTFEAKHTKKNKKAAGGTSQTGTNRIQGTMILLLLLLWYCTCSPHNWRYNTRSPSIQTFLFVIRVRVYSSSSSRALRVCLNGSHKCMSCSTYDSSIHLW